MNLFKNKYKVRIEESIMDLHAKRTMLLIEKDGIRLTTETQRLYVKYVMDISNIDSQIVLLKSLLSN